ncbi:hypothetical protein [Vagococcus fluvialis]|uniref:hypothetical protein n=1 Tax=Vagococcus fluvialis TaxID=2738 RepID=UPI0037886342
MNNSNTKVILFIVEGDYDRLFYREYLTDFIKEFFSGSDIKFSLSDGDILTNKNTNNLISYVEETVHSALDEHKITLDDVIYIVHLCDVDGSYIADESFEVDSQNSLEYNQNYKYARNGKIYTKDFEYQEDELKVSWKIKKNNQETMIRENEILGIEYKLFYNSLYLEHFLTGNFPIYNDEKKRCVEDTLDEIENFNELEEFIREKSLSDDYIESWELLKEHKNQMCRTSNLNIFFNEMRELSEKL